MIALDEQGALVCERLASLLRAQVREPQHRSAQAIRNRFGFIRLRRDPLYPVLTEVQALMIDPSERLWNIGEPNWQQPSLQHTASTSFLPALRRAIGEVLHYVQDEDLLYERNIVVQAAHLNIFFVGHLIPPFPNQNLLNAFLKLPPGTGNGTTFEQQLGDMIGQRIEDLKKYAEFVRSDVVGSVSLDLVVRGAFLSLMLPTDSSSLVGRLLKGRGTTFGSLLIPPQTVATHPHFVGYDEPPLHFCSLYSEYDDRGARYDGSQITNMMASAIYALMQSELLNNNTCATQLGLRDPYAGPYERLISITAIRSVPLRADMLDYAALQYGAHMIDALLPDP
ncbi:MAG: hypothetical protein WCJ55_10005, partial [Chloroflexales bacterium]